MNEARFKIMFDGQLMPDTTLEAVKENLSRLFKLEQAQVNALFGRGPIAIKRALQEEQADRYVQALQAAGARVRKEPDLAGNLSLEPVESAQTERVQKDSVTMECPKCGQSQPTAAECAGCGIIIEKYLARQAQATPAREPASPYEAPRADRLSESEGVADLAIFTTNGRIGRLRYLAWSLVWLIVTVALVFCGTLLLAVLDVLGYLAFAAIGIAALVVAVQIGVQRLHDIGWSGWLYLIFVIPVIGNLFALVTVIAPGSPGANRFGPPPPPNGIGVKVTAALALIVFGVSLVVSLMFPD